MLSFSVQPFAYVVGNYTCYNGEKESNNNIQSATSFLLERVNSMPIIVAPLVGARIEILMQDPFNLQVKSLPSRERGLKYPLIVGFVSASMSLPSRERGLKFRPVLCDCCCHVVAPLVGARIEIIRYLSFSVRYLVAPLVGAWIEISTC